MNNKENDVELERMRARARRGTAGGTAADRAEGISEACAASQ